MNGDGWLPAALPVARLARDVAELKTLVEAAGRDFSKIAVAPQYMAYLDSDHDRAVARFRESQMHKHLVSLTQSTLREQAEVSPIEINLIGTPAEVVEKCLALADAGVTHLLGIYFAAATVDELADQMTLFATEVMPHIARAGRETG